MGFDERSEKALATCNPQLSKVMRAALAVSDVPFQVIQGARTIQQQREYYLSGNSNVNPDAYPNPIDLYKAAKHITGPGMPTSRACDIIVDDPKKKWDKETLCFIAGVVLTVAKTLGVNMRCGINWNSDSEILTDQKLDDYGHYELI